MKLLVVMENQLLLRTAASKFSQQNVSHLLEGKISHTFAAELLYLAPWLSDSTSLVVCQVRPKVVLQKGLRDQMFEWGEVKYFFLLNPRAQVSFPALLCQKKNKAQECTDY